MKNRLFWLPLTGIVFTALLQAAHQDVPDADSVPVNPLPATAPKTLPSLDQARRQAELLHTAMHSMLQNVHHRYYREDEGLPIPAAVMRDVFSDLQKQHAIRLRWLAVEGQAMNTDHEASNPFEHDAVRVLKSGQGHYEQLQNGIYSRAAAIALTGECLKCHVPNRKDTKERTAGLIISMSVSP